jgi:hypothetical protein
MPDLTDEEYDALEEYWTIHTPKVSGDGKSGFFAKHKDAIIIWDDLSETRIPARAEGFNKVSTESTGEMVREKIAVGV